MIRERSNTRLIKTKLASDVRPTVDRNSCTALKSDMNIPWGHAIRFTLTAGGDEIKT